MFSNCQKNYISITDIVAYRFEKVSVTENVTGWRNQKKCSIGREL